MSLRKLHKYISLLVSLQLLLWTISGIYFSFNKIENVRGEQYYKTQEVEETTAPINLSKVSQAFAFEVIEEETFLTPLISNLLRKPRLARNTEARLATL